ncbi:MAG: hypothetical protein AAGK28_01085 [Pseudomonadota bacterium]
MRFLKSIRGKAVTWTAVICAVLATSAVNGSAFATPLATPLGAQSVERMRVPPPRDGAVMPTRIALKTPDRRGRTVLVVRNDRGGSVGTRAREIAHLRAADRAVELRGRVCLSSCTMYLSLRRVCVSPSTTFGFHGPSYYGRPLSAHDFEHWSHVIADHYPAALKDWYLTTGRYRSRGYFRMKGSDLIRMGVAQCR